MCTGEFKCECKGQLRTPSEDFLNTLKEYANTHSEMNDKTKLQTALDDNSV